MKLNHKEIKSTHSYVKLHQNLAVVLILKLTDGHKD